MRPANARHPAATLMLIRNIHGWIGMLVAPSVLFLAFTGILQIYSLHEAHGSYVPAPVIERLGRLHKDQVFAPGEHHKGPAKAVKAPPPAEDAHGDEDKGPSLPTLMLKLYLALVAASLIVSTSFGLWMALRPGPRRRLNLLLLAAGTLIPVALAALTA